MKTMTFRWGEIVLLYACAGWVSWEMVLFASVQRGILVMIIGTLIGLYAACRGFNALAIWLDIQIAKMRSKTTLEDTTINEV